MSFLLMSGDNSITLEQGTKPYRSNHYCKADADLDLIQKIYR